MARAYSALSCARSPTATSDSHVPAIRLPEPAHRRFGRTRLLRLRLFPAHVDDRDLVRRRRGTALHEAADAAVLHRDVARGTDEVRLLEPAPLHRRVVVREAEVRPVELHRVGALRQDLAHRET